MHVVYVNFKIKEGHTDDFLKRVIQHSENSLNNEPECQVFDVCIDPGNKSLVVLYEAYTDKPAFEYHSGTTHFNEFEKDVEHMVDEKIVHQFEKVNA